MKSFLKTRLSKILFFVFSFIIGVTLVMQFKLVETMNNGQSISDKAAHLQLELLMQDPQAYEVLINNYDLILSIINKLNAAGAEGIAINDERIVAVTDFKYDQGNLHVNSNPIKPPFILRAIGNPDTLEASLNIRYGILWELKNNFGISSRIEKRKTVELPMYVKEIVYKFAEVVED